MKGFLIFCLLLFLSSSVLAERIVVKHFFDGEHYFQKGPFEISFEKGKITAIKKTTIKARYDFLMPPFIDAHIHATSYAPHSHKDFEKELQFNFDLNQVELTKLAEFSLRDWRNKGFLYLRDLGRPRLGEKVLKALYKVYNDELPYLLKSAVSFSWGLGQCHKPYPCDSVYTNIKNWSAERLKKEIRALKGKALIKVYADNEPIINEHMPLSVIKLIMTEAKKNGLLVALHFSEKNDLKEILRFNKDYNSFEHLFNSGPELFKNGKENNIIYVPTVTSKSFVSDLKKKGEEWKSYFFDKKDFEPQLKRLINNKVPLCFGSDFYLLRKDPIKTMAYFALESLLEYHRLGMVPLELLKTVTSHCYPLFKTSTIRPGYIREGEGANFLFLKGNPMKDPKDLHNIEALYKAGLKIK